MPPGGKFKKIQILPVFSSFDNDILAEKISVIGNDAYEPVVEHTAAIEDENIILIPGKTGYDGNPDSKVAPALTKFERYMLKYESSDVKVEEVESKDDIYEEEIGPVTILEFISALEGLNLDHASTTLKIEGKVWNVSFTKITRGS